MLVPPQTTLIHPFPYLWFIPWTSDKSGTIPKCSSLTSDSESHTSVGSNLPQSVGCSGEVFHWLILRDSTPWLWADPPPVMALEKLRQVLLMRLFGFPCLPPLLCAPLCAWKQDFNHNWTDEVSRQAFFHPSQSISGGDTVHPTSCWVKWLQSFINRQKDPMCCPTGWICM